MFYALFTERNLEIPHSRTLSPRRWSWQGKETSQSCSYYKSYKLVLLVSEELKSKTIDLPFDLPCVNDDINIKCPIIRRLLVAFLMVKLANATWLRLSILDILIWKCLDVRVFLVRSSFTWAKTRIYGLFSKFKLCRLQICTIFFCTRCNYKSLVLHPINVVQLFASHLHWFNRD